MSEQTVLLTLSGICFFIGIFFWLWLSKLLKKKKISRKIKKGIRLEEKAAQLLIKKGYTILSHHQKISYTAQYNKSQIPIKLETDYIVAKKGKTFLVEVKSGEHTAHIQYAATRRQILEYYCASSYDGYLLVNMYSQTINTIHFPFKQKNRNKYGLILFLFSIIIYMLAFSCEPYKTYGILLIGIALFITGIHKMFNA
jgi:Holliday junction resolvase-like predicted endonuclease